jgi:hypothetical protein
VHETKRQRKEYLCTVSHVCEDKHFRTPWSHVPITFSEADLRLQHYPHNDPLVIRANIGRNSVHFAGNDVGRILVDNGSSADVLTWQRFVKMGFTKKNLHKSQYPLIGFGGKKIEALGKIELNLTFGEGNTQRTELITFGVVDIAYPYNAIFGCNSIIKFAVVINQAFLCMKIPTAGGVITILGNQEEARRCEDNAACAMKNVHAIEADNNDGEDEEATPLNSEQHDKDGVMPAEHTKKVLLCEDVPNRTVTIGKGLEEAEESRLIQFLRNNQDVFAWSSLDLRAVSREVMEHELKADLKVKPCKQRLRTMSEDRKKAAQSKVQKLLKTGVIREVQYPEWLANVVMVQKRMEIRGCASISPPSTSSARKMSFLCLALTLW